MRERIVILVTLIVITTWFLSGNFGAVASIFSARKPSLPTDTVVTGEEKEQALKEIHEILRNKR